MSTTIDAIDLSVLDDQLFEFVPQAKLKALAKLSLRGELVFAVPCLLVANPKLLGYYRLLLGFSQKEFYSTHFGVSGFKSMETKGKLSQKNRDELGSLCTALVSGAIHLIDGIGIDRLNKQMLYDLTLLTVGPQLRGSANVKKGLSGSVSVFQVIHDLVAHTAVHSAPNMIELINAANRRVLIEFAQDPDIIIREEMMDRRFRNIIAIEVKAGTDFSNIHNRIGEAEKSHQKAKARGFVECWTVVNVDNIDLTMAATESPTTNRFYRISELANKETAGFNDFKNRILGLTAITSY